MADTSGRASVWKFPFGIPGAATRSNAQIASRACDATVRMPATTAQTVTRDWPQLFRLDHLHFCSWRSRPQATELGRDRYGGQSLSLTIPTPYCCSCCYSTCSGMRTSITLRSAGVDDEKMKAPERMADPPIDFHCCSWRRLRMDPSQAHENQSLLPSWDVAAAAAAWTIAATCSACIFGSTCVHLDSAGSGSAVPKHALWQHSMLSSVTSAATAWMGWKVQASCDCTSGHIELPVDL